MPSPHITVVSLVVVLLAIDAGARVVVVDVAMTHIPSFSTVPSPQSAPSAATKARAATKAARVEAGEKVFMVVNVSER